MTFDLSLASVDPGSRQRQHAADLWILPELEVRPSRRGRIKATSIYIIDEKKMFYVIFIKV